MVVFFRSLEIRRFLGLKSGDKILFYKNQTGEIVVSNASSNAVQKAQNAFVNAAEAMNIDTEDDIQNLVNEVRNRK